MENRIQINMENDNYNHNVIPETGVWYVKEWQGNGFYPIYRITKVDNDTWLRQAQKIPLDNIVEEPCGNGKFSLMCEDNRRIRVKDPKRVVYRGMATYNRNQLQYCLDNNDFIISENEMFDDYTYNDQ